MLTLSDVQALVRELSGTKVLSVYLETRVTDPAMRDAWRPALASALRDLAARVPAPERPEFERARAVLNRMESGLGGTWGAEGWVAFATAGGAHHSTDVPTAVPTLATWRDGPVVAPYMRVLKEHRPVIIALVDSRSAKIYRYTWGKLEELPDLAITAGDYPAPGEAHGPDRRGHAVAAPRSVTGTERARRRQSAAFDSLSAELATRLTKLAGNDGWIVIGGTREWARAAADALPERVASRVSVSAALSHDAGSADITTAAQRAATELRAAHGQALLDTLYENAAAPTEAASGVPAVQRALRANAVEALLLSPDFMRRDGDEAENAVRAALLHGADVSVLSGDAAARLDRTAHGVGAKLRFAVD
jgi:hypothetical protein